MVSFLLYMWVFFTLAALSDLTFSGYWHTYTHLCPHSEVCEGRPYHFCMTFDLEEECYICYAFWFPYVVYIKDFSKFHCFPPVLSSWWSSIHLLELKIQMWRIPPCHTSKVASWHVHWRYELHLLPSLSKIWLIDSKSGKNWQYCRKHKILQVFET